MHRSSGSTTRVSDEFLSAGTNSSAAAAVAAAAAMSSPNPKPTAAATTASDSDHLPTYNPLSHVAKKEKIRFRSAENAIHLIPLLLVLCAVILWFFSSPVDHVMNESDSLVARVGDSLIKTGGDGGRSNSSWESDEQEEIDTDNQSTDSDHATNR